ncbi:hypothetical protein Bca4012_070157 [Brassica carinata]|uniref:Uncharacterized protein n=5 Tax=Brassica TaxID=3705 RepID=A0ABQ7ZAB8_BRANA|nr:PREDICTED: uncharacterized protein LOC106293518 [Brassica oleracea var. oleracea]XP_013697780.1 uncharacterized protein BNAC05G07280D [Brassica napus]KAF2555276.1 hypothetical protein F2Q68_00013134 [Brassica cretica]KAG2267758.1 hypothetical protein Bca52824_062313 [Brassica carinata]VDD41996.1 unnamed protein product [Brassica oleracea]KAH0877041.1 hypothetical protein HID58_064435 [Brassica napus]
MNESSSWSIYSTKDGESDGPWRSSTSMNAISFGFVATAILISMFLLMAIFEHLFRPENSTFESPHRIRQRQNQSRDGSTHFQKLANQASMVPVNMVVDVSVVMPGEKLPSHIALPAPLPCGREGIRWPLHR